jgi:hypothetical protein
MKNTDFIGFWSKSLLKAILKFVLMIVVVSIAVKLFKGEHVNFTYILMMIGGIAIAGYLILGIKDTESDSNAKCAAGEHEVSHPNGEPANFCGNCGFQVNPEAYKKYLVTLVDGDVVEVSAVNESHARSLVIYGGDMRLLEIPGSDIAEPIGDIKVNPHNIKSVTTQSNKR